MKKIKFAIVGLGFIGKKHQFFIQNDPNAELTATIDPYTEADYQSIDEFIRQDNETDVVCITTPNALHSEHAIQLMNAGYHVVVEKPLAIKYSSAKALLQASQDTEKKVFVVMQNRYSPASKWLKSMVDEDRLGDLFMVQINCFWNRDERYYKGKNWHGKKDLDGGSLYTQFSHFVDLLYWCFGEMIDFSSEFFDFNHQGLTEFEDSGVVQFKFKHGGHGQFNFSTSCHSRNLESSITILSSKATIKIGGQYMENIEHCDIDNYTYSEVQPYTEQFGKFTGNSANHRFVISNVVKTLNGEAEPDTDLMDGVEVVKAIEEMYNSTKH